MAKQGSKAKKRILKAKIDFLSLCPRGANTLQTVYKAMDGTDHNVSLSVLSKDMTEQGEIFAVVYAPEIVDSQGDVASAEVIKEMAYNFAQQGQGIDIRHNEEVVPKDKAFIAESFIVQKGDPRFAGMKTYSGETVDVTGAWGTVIKIEDESLRQLYRDGEWGGLSMGGMMLTKDEGDPSSLRKMFKEFLDEILPKRKQDTEIDMDAKELKAALDENNKNLVKALKEVFAPEKTAEEIAAEKAAKEAAETPKKGMGYPKPVLKDGASPEEIERFEKEMEIYQLSEAVDRNDLQSVRDFQKMAKAIASGDETEATHTKKQDSPYGSFFNTNQDGVTKKNKGEQTYADAILEEMEKEEKENLKLAV